MKRLTSILLCACLMTSLVGCGGTAESKPEASEASVVESVAEETEEATEEVASEEEEITEEAEVSEEEMIDDPEWDKLESLGNVTAENGIFTVSITMPADFVGEEVTQESLDADAKDGYLSAKLNDDGSVTYKMTKAQHKAMKEEMAKGIEESFEEMISSEDYAFTEIKHNKDFTQYDCTLSTTEIGMNESLMMLAFVMYTGWYSVFSGETPESVIVNYYDPDHNLIDSLDSADWE